MDQQEQHNVSSPEPQATSITNDSAKSRTVPSVFLTIQHATAWVMIISAILFAIVGILGVWQVLGDNAGDVVWRALSSLAIIAFAALIINVSVRMAEDRRV